MKGIETGGGRGTPTPARKRSPRKQQANPRLSSGAIAHRQREDVPRTNVQTPRVVAAQVRDTKSDADRARAKPTVDRELREIRGRQVTKALQQLGDILPTHLKAPEKPKRGGGGGPFIPAVIGSLKGAGALQAVSHSVGDVASGALRGGMAVGSLGMTEIPGPLKWSREIAQNAVKDSINLPAEAIPSLYHLGEQAVHGDVEGAARDLAQPYIDTLHSPGAFVHAFREHPIDSSLLFLGVKGGVGRGAGRIMRAVPGPTRRLASTAREPLTLEGSGLTVERRYSPDVITKGRQVLTERAASRAARHLERRADRLGGERGERLRDRAVAVRRTTVPTHELQRRVDERVDANEQLRREDRTHVVAAATRAVRDVHPKDRPIVALVSRGVIAPTTKALKAYRDQVAAARAGLTPAKAAANRELVKHIDRALAKSVDWQRVQRASSAYREVRMPLDKGLTDADIIAADQAERRRLLPYAVQNMGAKLKSADELDAQVAAARQKVHDTRQERARQERTHADSVAGFGVARGRAQVLSRNVGGAAAERRAEAATAPVGEPQFAGGGHGVNQASESLRRSASNLESARGAEASALDDLRAAVRERRLGSGFRHPDGRHLANEEIRAHMRSNGVDEPVYLTDAPNRRGARNFFRNQMEPANAGSGTFTGEAIRQGTVDIHPETLTEGAANAQALLSQQHGFGALIGEFGRRDKGGEVKSYENFRGAQQAANNLMHNADGSRRAGAVRWTPIRVNPFGGRTAQLEKLLEQADLDPSARRTVHDAMDSALRGEDGPGPWALVPETVASRMQEHLRTLGAGGAGKTAQVLNQAFRRTVLATSIPWLVGNVAEGAGRALIAHAGPLSWTTGFRLQRALEQMDPQAARELQARALGGAHFSMAERQKVRRAAEDFDGRITRPLATALGAFWRTPGPKQVADVWGIWTDAVFNQVNGRYERQVQRAMLGKAVRRSALMEGSVTKLGRRAIAEAARGATETPTQVALARAVDRAYGRYSKFSPTARKYIALYTPFAAWTIAATNFIYHVLPKDHPVLTSVIVAANEATEDWRREHGLDMFFAEGRLPGWLQGSVPTATGGHVRVSRFTPFGLATDPTESLAGLVLPQAQGVLAALHGEDWKGKELRDADGQPLDAVGRGTAAAGAFLESTIPALALGKRVAKDGAAKAVNPFPVIAPGKDEAVAVDPDAVQDPRVSRAFRRAQRATGSRSDSGALDRAFRRAQRLAGTP